ncbi:MAG TPA: glycosyltransferase family 4 protein [Verrucomicrobiota bacterium]|nr:MAG: putative glycosyl transferase [Verrucomicrobia bacterium ADurb.Bin063]HNW06800.1 glycosyltransferase family 4 protein [Verrucomicrobiota bacterium]HOX62490.1 glycosyltransferase family 4 protein [Verrucomicrobiota bacterium]HPI63939.1 glycosyltransferase family 4 protein [Verrucomicrobiota bacterium]HPO41995.1 glycosyltransferase family 4 protein [Verrucomicrobiota bacterium]
MTFLLLNQTFHPDVMATGQYLTDVALRLVERGHQVTVVTSRRAYDQPRTQFPKEEMWRGIRVYRVGTTGFGKGAKWRRAADFASFLALASLRLARLPRPEVVVTLTSPPLISFLGAGLARLRRSRFFYWVMDFNPDEAIAAGWLRPHSPVARVLDWISRFSLRQARKILALDRFMRERIVAKGIAPAKVLVIPPWSHDTEVTFDAEGRERFRKAHGLDGKFVVMYSGNHSPVHPLDTLLAAARQLASNPDVTFCFIGGGSEWRKIQEKQKTDRTLSNIICLPYQPLDQLAGSLSAADLHVVVMGNDFVGLVHPCKIYNALSVGAPVLYIGPSPSHISEILDTLDGHYTCAAAHHGDVGRVVEQILRVRRESAALVRQPPKISSMFSRETLLPRLVAELEGQ